MAGTGDAGCPRPGRGFSLVDAMTLGAATAAGFASYRVCTDRWAGLGPIPFHRQPDLWVIESLHRIVTWTPLWLAPGTAGLLVLHSRHPRPCLGRLARQPGFVATGTATLVLMAGVIAIVSVLAVRCLPTWRLAYWGAFSWPLFFHCAFDLQLPAWVGAAVVGAWATLLLGGRWRPERSWLDRMGRLVGGCWVALLLVHLFLGPWFYLSNHFQVPPPALRSTVRSAWGIPTIRRIPSLTPSAIASRRWRQLTGCLPAGAGLRVSDPRRHDNPAQAHRQLRLQLGGRRRGAPAVRDLHVPHPEAVRSPGGATLRCRMLCHG